MPCVMNDIWLLVLEFVKLSELGTHALAPATIGDISIGAALQNISTGQRVRVTKVTATRFAVNGGRCSQQPEKWAPV